MRRLLRAIARNEDITQDLSTLENPAIIDQLRGEERPRDASAAQRRNGRRSESKAAAKPVAKPKAKVRGAQSASQKAGEEAPGSSDKRREEGGEEACEEEAQPARKKQGRAPRK